MEIKGISTLEWWLTKWLHDHGFTDIKARVAADFQYCHDEKTIYFALATTDEQDKKFLEFLQFYFGFPFECDNFLVSFFHELGHNRTWDKWTDEDWCDYFTSKDLLISTNAPVEEYYQLPIEEEASAWCVGYIYWNVQEIKEFWRVCQKLIMNIYKQNGVVDE